MKFEDVECGDCILSYKCYRHWRFELWYKIIGFFGMRRKNPANDCENYEE